MELFMEHVKYFVTLFFCLFCFWGCTANNYSHTTDLFNEVTLSQVRQYVHRQNVLSEKEFQDICTRIPDETGEYNLSGSFSQYKWSWSLDEGKRLTVSYLGDINNPNKEDGMSHTIVKTDYDCGERKYKGNG